MEQNNQLPDIVARMVEAQCGSQEQHDIIQAHMDEYFKRWPSYKDKFTPLEWYHIFLDFYDKTLATPKRMDATQMRALIDRISLACGFPIVENLEQVTDTIIKRLNRLESERDALRRFKDFVHRRLDEMGIPSHPDGEYSKAGCRIGDRLDIVQNAIAIRDAYATAARVIMLHLQPYCNVPDGTPDLIIAEAARRAALDIESLNRLVKDLTESLIEAKKQTLQSNQSQDGK
jgi:hypothetical protein